MLFKAVEVDTTGLLGFSFLVELNVWSSKGDSVGNMASEP
jgi:hypothetical protein